MFLTALGFLLNGYGIVVDRSTKSGVATVDYAALQFSGSFIAGVFWVSIADNEILFVTISLGKKFILNRFD